VDKRRTRSKERKSTNVMQMFAKLTAAADGRFVRIVLTGEWEFYNGGIP